MRISALSMVLWMAIVCALATTIASSAAASSGARGGTGPDFVWEDIEVIAPLATAESGSDYRQPTLIRDDDGGVLLAHVEDFPNQTQRVVARYSEDTGFTWSDLGTLYDFNPTVNGGVVSLRSAYSPARRQFAVLALTNLGQLTFMIGDGVSGMPWTIVTAEDLATPNKHVDIEWDEFSFKWVIAYSGFGNSTCIAAFDPDNDFGSDGVATASFSLCTSPDTPFNSVSLSVFPDGVVLLGSARDNAGVIVYQLDECSGVGTAPCTSLFPRGVMHDGITNDRAASFNALATQDSIVLGDDTYFNLADVGTGTPPQTRVTYYASSLSGGVSNSQVLALETGNPPDVCMQPALGKSSSDWACAAWMPTTFHPTLGIPVVEALKSEFSQNSYASPWTAAERNPFEEEFNITTDWLEIPNESMQSRIALEGVGLRTFLVAFALKPHSVFNSGIYLARSALYCDNHSPQIDLAPMGLEPSQIQCQPNGSLIITGSSVSVSWEFEFPEDVSIRVGFNFTFLPESVLVLNYDVSTRPTEYIISSTAGYVALQGSIVIRLIVPNGTESEVQSLIEQDGGLNFTINVVESTNDILVDTAGITLDDSQLEALYPTSNNKMSSIASRGTSDCVDSQSSEQDGGNSFSVLVSLQAESECSGDADGNGRSDASDDLLMWYIISAVAGCCLLLICGCVVAIAALVVCSALVSSVGGSGGIAAYKMKAEGEAVNFDFEDGLYRTTTMSSSEQPSSES